MSTWKRVGLVVLAAVCTAVIVFAATIGGSMIDVAVLMDSHERIEDFVGEGGRFTSDDGSALRAESQNGDAAIMIRVVALETNLTWVQESLRTVVAELNEISARLNSAVTRLEYQNGKARE